MSAISPILALRLVLDDTMPVCLRGADSFSRDHSLMEPKVVEGEYPLHLSHGWTTPYQRYNNPGRSLLMSLMAGSWAGGLEAASIGRSSSRPGSATVTPLLEARTNPLIADGSTSFDVGLGHLALPTDHPEPLNRWFVSTADHSPDQAFSVTFTIPPGVFKGDGVFLQVYHAGPVGCKDGTKGSGKYCTQFMLDGSARLWELEQEGASWFEHARFTWTDVMPNGQAQTILICPRAYYSDGNWVGSTIDYIVQWPKSAGGTLITQILSISAALLTRGRKEQSVTVGINDGSATVGAFQTSKAMVEVRRDIPALVNISNEWQSESTFEDKPFTLSNADSGADADHPLTIWTAAIAPTGSTLEIDLYAYNPESEAWVLCTTVAGSTQTGYWGTSKQVLTVEGCNRYKMRFHLDVDSSGRAPVVRYYGCYRKGVYRMTTTAPITINECSGAKITDIVIEYGEDMTQENAKIVLVEDGRYTNPFDLRSNIPIRIEADVLDPRDMETVSTCYLFSGRVLSAPSEAKWMKLHDDVDGLVYERVLICIGEASRLRRQLTQHSLNLINVKVTDALKSIAGEQGIPSEGDESMFDIPDWGMKIMPFDKNNIGFVEMMSDVYGVWRTLTEDWLGAMSRYDLGAVPVGATASSHRHGMIRVMARPEGTETPLAHFVGFVPGFEGQEGEKTSDTYKSFVDPGATSSNRAPYIFIDQEGYLQNVVGPDFNRLIVTGSGLQNIKISTPLGDIKFTGLKSKKLTAVLHNYKSTWFRDDQPVEPDNTSCDWLDEAVTYYECNTGYSTRQVVENVAKVRMRHGGQGYYVRQFQCPFWPIWNYSDTLQARPRRLEFGDVVDFSLVQGSTPAPFIVTKPRIWINEDDGGVRQARYYFVLESPRPGWPVARGEFDE